MTTLLTIIVVIIAFSFLVFIHELGHFLMAKKAGIKVIEFAIGFPPRIFSKKKGETTYSINAIPFGGYVRLYGEDASDQKMLRSKKSFASKTLRQRILVVIGGVVMNFITALLLFTIGFTIGMKPLIPTEDPLNTGIIEVKSGAIIKSIPEDSPLFENQIPENTQITQINNQPIQEIEALETYLKENTPNESITILKNNRPETIQITDQNTPLKIELHPFQPQFPRLKIQSITPNSASAQSGLQPNDTILSINGTQITNFDQYQESLKSTSPLNYKILRNNQEIEIQVPTKNQNNVIIDKVFPDTPASKTGLKSGDIITSINNETPIDAQRAVNLIQKNSSEVSITVLRNNQEMQFKTKLQNSLLGISPRTIYSPQNQHLNLYLTSTPTSITQINNLQYPPHIAAMESLKLMNELSKITASGFVNLLKSVATSLEVPSDVGGAVALTTMIHQSVQSGFTDVLQLIAYISLVLAVINILPLPALDGGRLLFLIIEGITGKRIKPQWEAYIHSIGFLLLLLLIILITYTDITRLS